MEGLGQFIFIAIIIALTLVDGAARRKKRQGRGPDGLPPRPPERPKPRSAQGPRTTSGPAPRPPSTGPDEAEATSEGLIPADVWQEILGLARGEPQTPDPASAPGRPPDASSSGGTPEETLPPDRSRDPLPEADTEPPPARGPIFRPDPGLLETRPATPMPPPLVASVPSAPVAAASRAPTGGRNLRIDLFGGVSAGDLRKAVILKEVLGLPVSLRE